MAAVVLVMGAGQSETLTVKRIMITDGDGVPRMALSTTKAGKPYIGLSDAKGNLRCSLSLDANDEPRLIAHEEGKEPHDLVKP